MKKFILIVNAIIIICSVILLYKINTTPISKTVDVGTYTPEDIFEEGAEDFEEYIAIEQNREVLNNKDTVIPEEEIAKLIIPKIELIYPVLEETNKGNLDIALTKFWGNNPNEIGNFCITGHNNRNDNRFFKRLDELEKGDEIWLLSYNNGQILEYKVYDKYVVKPNELECTSQLTNGKKEVTLITCANMATQRLIIKCIEGENV